MARKRYKPEQIVAKLRQVPPADRLKRVQVINDRTGHMASASGQDHTAARDDQRTPSIIDWPGVDAAISRLSKFTSET